MLTHGNLGANLRQMLALPGEIVRADDVSLAVVPLFHVFGLNVALGLSLATGAALVLESASTRPTLCEPVRELGVTHVLGRPGHVRRLGGPGRPRSGGGRPRRSAAGATGHLRCRCPRRGGGVAFRARFGDRVWQGYGLTEASPAVATSLGTGRNRPGSVGQPLPGVSRCSLVDEADEPVLEPATPARSGCGAPTSSPATGAIPMPRAEVLTADGWLRTGDIGVIGEDGDLFVVDRSKDLVIVSGFNVYPAEVEQVVASLPGVAEAVVIGRPDPDHGRGGRGRDRVGPRGGRSPRSRCATTVARRTWPATSARPVGQVRRPSFPMAWSARRCGGHCGSPGLEEPVLVVPCPQSGPPTWCPWLPPSVRSGHHGRSRSHAVFPRPPSPACRCTNGSSSSWCAAGTATVSSDQLAEMARVNASKVRKDLSFLGSFGTRGSGYDAKFLLVADRPGARHPRRLAGGHRRPRQSRAGRWPTPRGSPRGGFGCAGSVRRRTRPAGQPDPRAHGPPPRRVRDGGGRRPADHRRHRHTRRRRLRTSPTGWSPAGVGSVLNFAPEVLTVPPDVLLRYVDLSIELQVMSFYLSHRDQPGGRRGVVAAVARPWG